MGDASLIERAVAAAITELERQRDHDDIFDPYVDARGDPNTPLIDGQIDLAALVRAVIITMREPSEAMQRAWQGPEAWDQDALEIWQAMIDAALSTNG